MIIFLAIFIIFQIVIMSSYGLTDLDYSLRKLKHSDGKVSSNQSFHGANSAMLSVFEKNRFSRVYINLKEPMDFEDLDQLNFWINPQSGSGSIQIEIYLEGKGEKKIVSLKMSLDEMKLSKSQWNEIDAFDLEYSDSKCLDDLKKELKGKKIKKIYITLYNTGKDGSTTKAFIDYIRIGNQLISFEPLEKEDVKDGPSSASAGGLITYTITYANNGMQPVDVVVKEDYDPKTFFIESTPAPDPGTSNTWTFPKLPAGKHGQIIIKMRTIKPSARASITGCVSGRGFASTEGRLSTDAESYEITNTVHITAGEFNHMASVSTRIRPIIGSVLQYGEHGSGDYMAEETIGFNPTSISVERSVSGVVAPVSVNLSPDSLCIDGDWSAKVLAKNDYRDIFWSDRYHEAETINVSYVAHLGKSLSSLQTVAHAKGLLDRTARWPEGASDTHLAGDFNITGRAKWRWANKTVSPDKEWLPCCSLENDPAPAL